MRRIAQHEDEGSAVPTVATVLTLVLCAAAVVAFQREAHVVYHVLKVLASAFFIAVAFSAGIPADAWRVALAAGLVVALVGDALLSRHETWTFVGGMAAFLTMHLCYVAGFLARGFAPATFMIAAVASGTLVVLVWRWARAHLPDRLRAAIAVYMGILALDLAAGVATGITRPGGMIAAGVLLVGLSDVSGLETAVHGPEPCQQGRRASPVLRGPTAPGVGRDRIRVSTSSAVWVSSLQCHPPLEGAHMSGKFVLADAANGQFRFNLKAANGQTVLTSQAYASKPGALNGVESVKKNAPLDERYERRTAKDGSPYFVLMAANAQEIGRSQMYSSPASMENGVESVKSNAPDAEIVDETGAPK